MNRIVARIALPIVSAGVLSGAALGLAGMAGATVTTTQNGIAHRDRGHPGHLREARPQRDAGLALPPRPRPRLPGPVSPQLNNN